MQRGSMTDREAYPTAWITLAVLVLLYLLWRFALGAPTVSRCWVWEHWHVYCPGCGGTRALMALAQGRVGAALWYHTPVVITLALAAIYGPSGAVPGQLRGPERPVAGPRRPAVKRI